MVRHARRLFAALALTALVLAPGAALAGTRVDNFDGAGSPPVVDILLMRPLGAVGLVASLGLYLPAAAVTAMTRPSEMHVPYEWLVEKPIRFVFKDPIGSH